MPRPPEERFEALFIPEPNSGCWLWIGSLDTNGYAKFHFDGGSVKASRYSWSKENGPIPNGLHILHRCDFPPCVNPDHLFPGTNLDNILDCWAKGRRTIVADTRGDKHGNAQLSPTQVALIRADNRRHADIAKDFGLSRSQISKIKNGSAWRHG